LEPSRGWQVGKKRVRDDPPDAPNADEVLRMTHEIKSSSCGAVSDSTGDSRKAAEPSLEFLERLHINTPNPIPQTDPPQRLISRNRRDRRRGGNARARQRLVHSGPEAEAFETVLRRTGFGGGALAIGTRQWPPTRRTGLAFARAESGRRPGPSTVSQKHTAGRGASPAVDGPARNPVLVDVEPVVSR
jgi:hypothetical protein